MCVFSFVTTNHQLQLQQLNFTTEKVRPADIVDGNPSCTLQLIYAIAVYTSLTKDWGVKLPNLPESLISLQPPSASTAGVPLTCGRRLVNWTSLRKVLLDFVAPRLRFCTDIPKNSEGHLLDLGPSLIDGKVILALLHHAHPKDCPYDPYPNSEEDSDMPTPTASSSSSMLSSKKKKNQKKEVEEGGEEDWSGTHVKSSPHKGLKKDLTCEEVENIRRNAFTRANVLLGCPPLLSDGMEKYVYR
jgi:hypothetical protein